MITYVTFLRALAACLITNAHYTGIYPTDLIANGGLVGDVVFFAVSGFCLYNIRLNFPLWYGKRVIRIYVPVLIMTAVYMLCGAYQITQEHNALWWFVYPTYYHFVASIIVLYIPYYIIMRTEKLKNNLLPLMIAVGIAYLIIYIFVYDKSYYHIDKVREPMVRFLYMESMLLGAWFRQKDEKYRNKNWKLPAVLSILFFGIYFASKLLFAKIESLSSLQIINQFAIFVLLYFILRLFAALDTKFESAPKALNKAISFVAELTLEIYLVQYVIIDLIRPHFFFPLNWVVLTAAIIVSAYALHMICKPIIKFVGAPIEKSIGGG